MSLCQIQLPLPEIIQQIQMCQIWFSHERHVDMCVISNQSGSGLAVFFFLEGVEVGHERVELEPCGPDVIGPPSCSRSGSQG